MKKIIILLIMIMGLLTAGFTQVYEPLDMRSGGMLGAGNLRFVLDWAYQENNSVGSSTFDFGLDFGVGPSLEWQNRIGYRSVEGSDYQWAGWLELLKFQLGHAENGPAYALGTGIYIPVRKSESLGLLAGLYISSAIKDIDFDFNIGFDPFYLTYADLGNGVKVRNGHDLKIDLRLGYKILPFFKILGGFRLDQYFDGKQKITIGDQETTQTIDGGAAWNFILGGRLKPMDYPIVFDTSISFGVSSRSEYDWQLKFGLQFQPQSPNAEW
ncbi:MAG: hypothetical protein JW827_01215 [Spirochaetes bacterium]|nr:hypothetical protein [Spirochaetota bacterium]